MGRLFPSGLGETLVKNEEVRKGDIIELGGKRRRACSLGVSNNVVPRDAEQGHRQLAAILDGGWLHYLFNSLGEIELAKLFT